MAPRVIYVIAKIVICKLEVIANVGSYVVCDRDKL